MATDILHRYRAHGSSVEARENGYHRIPIKEVDQESMGSEMRDLHTFGLGDAFV